MAGGILDPAFPRFLRASGAEASIAGPAGHSKAAVAIRNGELVGARDRFALAAFHCGRISSRWPRSRHRAGVGRSPGPGHFFKECLAAIRGLEDVDLFVSRAAAEVVRMYRDDMNKLPSTARIFKDTTASAAPVGHFYHGVYHTLVVAPATSNTVAKCVYGISDNLATNVFAQAGKCRVPIIVFACDTAPELDTKAPHGMVKVYPRRIDLENVEKLKSFESTQVVESLEDLTKALASASGMSEHLLFLTGHLALPRLGKVLAAMQPTPFTFEVRDIGVKVASLMTARYHPPPIAAAAAGRPGHPARALRGDLDALSAGVRRALQPRA